MSQSDQIREAARQMQKAIDANKGQIREHINTALLHDSQHRRGNDQLAQQEKQIADMRQQADRMQQQLDQQRDAVARERDFADMNGTQAKELQAANVDLQAQAEALLRQADEIDRMTT